MLFKHRWTIPVLAALDELDGGAKFVTLQRRLGVSRDSLQRTLTTLVDTGLVGRNPGYGHPMRPEYTLTTRGSRLAPACAALLEGLRDLGVEDIGLRKWSLPLTYSLAQGSGRFNRLCDDLDVTPRALAQALKELQHAGLVERLLVEDSPPRTEYRLTGKGKRLTPLISALAREYIAT